MSPIQSVKLEVDLEPIQLVGKERDQYESLERLVDFSLGRSDEADMTIDGIRKVMKDWDRMLGGNSILARASENYLARMEIGDRLASRTLYLLSSPMIFYIHSLYQVTRKGWRNSITSCGIFCERIVRNLALFLDMHLPSEHPISDMKTFADKNGRIKHQLEELGVPESDNLFHLLKRMYSARSTMGPHDVPPPEPIEAKINLSLCLPLYIDYIHALDRIGATKLEEGMVFASFMDQSARVNVQLAFGNEVQTIPAGLVLRDRLYRPGFFASDQNLKDVGNKFRQEGYSFTDSVIANALRTASTSRLAFLTRTRVGGIYFYRERLPPHEYFRTLL